MPSTYAPRLSVVIDEEDMFALRKHLPIGFQKVIFNLIVKDLIKLFEKHGSNQVIAAFCAQDISLVDMCRLTIGGSNDNDTQSAPVHNSNVRRTSYDSFADAEEE